MVIFIFYNNMKNRPSSVQQTCRSINFADKRIEVGTGFIQNFLETYRNRLQKGLCVNL